MDWNTNDGKHFAAEDAEELVDLMRADSFYPGEDRAAYMREVAIRTSQWNGARVRHDTPERFVADLEAAEVLVRYDLGNMEGHGNA